MNFDFRFRDETEIGLAVICDLHVGSKQCDVAAVKSWIKTIKDNQWKVLLGGDLLEMSLKNSVGDVYDQQLSPLEQIDSVVEMLKPIKDQILHSVGGNHEYRVVKAVGIDPSLLIARELGVGYSAYQSVGRIQVGEAHWKIGLTHGAGGGSLLGSKLNVAMKLSKVYPNLDLYMSGHTHTDVSASDTIKDISLNKGRVTGTVAVRRFSGCGSLLSYEESYAEAKLMAPAAKAQVVHFLGDRKRISVDGVVFQDKSYRREVYHF